MLAHIAKAAAVVIPIAAKGLVNAVRVIRLFRGGTEPEIVIKLGRHGLRSEVGAAAPLILFPIKAGRPADSDFERPTQKSGLHQFLDGFHWNSHAIEIAFEPEPGIEPENPFVFRNRGLHRFTLGNSPAHGLLAPDPCRLWRPRWKSARASVAGSGYARCRCLCGQELRGN